MGFFAKWDAKSRGRDFSSSSPFPSLPFSIPFSIPSHGIVPFGSAVEFKMGFKVELADASGFSLLFPSFASGFHPLCICLKEEGEGEGGFPQIKGKSSSSLSFGCILCVSRSFALSSCTLSSAPSFP